MKKKILIFMSLYLPGYKGGGPIRTIANMVDAIGDEIDIFIVCRDRDMGDAHPYEGVIENSWNKVGKAQVFYLSEGVGGIYSMLRIIKKEGFSKIYVNSYFSVRFSVIPLILNKYFGNRLPVLIAPKGEFSTGALSIKHKKKKLFLFLSRFLGVYQKSVTWHASTIHELADITRVFPAAKAVVAMDLPEVPNLPVISMRTISSPIKLILVGRVSPMKNIVGALNILSRVNCSVDFHVYGPKEDEVYWDLCLAQAKELPKNINFRLMGGVSHEQIKSVLIRYDLFFLPTLGENYGHVIAEALAAGLPVIVSNNTPWRGLKEKGLGADISLDDLDGFVGQIEHYAGMSGKEFYQKRIEISKWANDNIRTKEQVSQNLALFE